MQTASRTKRALFVRGGWPGHQPVETSDLVAKRIREAGLFVHVEESLAIFEDAEALGHFEVIVPCWTMGKYSPEAETILCDRVALGAGIAGWHGGVMDACRTCTDYQFMIGGQFVAHPGGIVDYAVRITDNDHPVTRGLPAEFAVRSEQYYLHVDPSNRVLAETRFSAPGEPAIDGCVMPVVWTRRYGRGRVACCSIGHGVDDLSAEPVLTLVTRCILWGAGALE